MAGPDSNEPPRTVVMPSPGGRRPGPAGPASPLASSPLAAAPRLGARGPDPEFDASKARPGVNPLVDAASDLLDLVVYLQGQATPLEVAGLRRKTLALMKQFEARAAADGVEPGVLEVARYAVAATIDDAVLSKPWGIDSGYQNATLVGALYEEIIGGERFFEYLEDAEGDLRRYGDLIELMYICLSLGFQGVYRRRERGAQGGLDERRARAFEAVRARRQGFAEGLSLHWRGVETVRKPLRDLAPTWLVACLSGALAAGFFFWASWSVGDITARAIAATAAMPPQGEVRVAAIEVPPPEPPAPPPPPPQQARVSAFLDSEISEGIVEVLQQGGQVRIRLTGSGMFASASANLEPRYADALRRVAEALAPEPGGIRVEGHSDAQPIRTARFPSNFHLSKARAEAVAAFLTPLLSDPARLSVEGYGATEPLDADNPNGAVNRRVELVLDREAGQ